MAGRSVSLHQVQDKVSRGGVQAEDGHQGARRKAES